LGKLRGILTVVNPHPHPMSIVRKVS
jgi:hypothetical protein